MAWEYEIALSATVNQNTPENRTALATIFANYSAETIADERLMFDKALRLSVSGEEPAQVLAVNFVATGAMRTDLRTFLDSLPQAQIAYWVRANTILPMHFDGELLLVGGGAVDIVGVPPWDTQPFSFQDALERLNIEAGLQVIQGEEI